MAGEVVHVEIPAEDVDRAQRFYSGVFGWQFGESVMPEMEYRMAQINDSAGAAVMSATDKQDHANHYHDVADIDAAVAKVRELGGEAADKMPVPGMGWFAAGKDSEGNALHLWQRDASAGQ
jgi:predicted enzyme related to lactoylglutathione lyase